MRGPVLACDSALHVLGRDLDAHCSVKNLQGLWSHVRLDEATGKHGCTYFVVRVRVLHAHFLHRLWREQRPNLLGRESLTLQHMNI